MLALSNLEVHNCNEGIEEETSRYGYRALEQAFFGFRILNFLSRLRQPLISPAAHPLCTLR